MSRVTAADLRTVRDVAIGGALGALLRSVLVLLAVAATRGELLVVIGLNVVGAYLLARLLSGAERDDRWRRHAALLGTGLLGALTTFSGLVLPLAFLAADGDPAAAVAWGFGNLGLGLAAAAVGLRGTPS
ncbi:CrcB family protein [Egicoccus sp. AB-alg6-2]|uniref:CrcB family protein n=1 Tax=Egicoccus sp. AB-alg6-2 TaxID=3242692 RepID=UPI00359E6B79